MKLSFSWKLGIVLTLLSVSLTSAGVYCFYCIAYKNTMEQIGKNLLHVGRLGALMFDDEAREAIKRLDVATARDSIVSAEDIAAMKPISTLKSLMGRAEQLSGSLEYFVRDGFCVELSIPNLFRSSVPEKASESDADNNGAL